jgi:hypothetical protein
MTRHQEQRLFTAPDAWEGGTHELTLVYRHVAEATLASGREAIWSFPDLEGCWRRRDREPARQARVSPRAVGLETTLYGMALIPGAGRVACETFVTREDDGLDLLQLILPIGSLGAVLPLGDYPFDDGGDLSWRDALDGWLCRLAEHVRQSVPFERALVGWLDGQPDALPEAPGEVPAERWIGYLVPGPDGLAWHPPNMGAPLSFADPDALAS